MLLQPPFLPAFLERLRRGRFIASVLRPSFRCFVPFRALPFWVRDAVGVGLPLVCFFVGSFPALLLLSLSPRLDLCGADPYLRWSLPLRIWLHL